MLLIEKLLLIHKHLYLLLLKNNEDCDLIIDIYNKQTFIFKML